MVNGQQVWSIAIVINQQDVNEEEEEEDGGLFSNESGNLWERIIITMLEWYDISIAIFTKNV